MNGISLLLVISSLAATAGVERGSNGQPVYVIRIESLLVNEMRNGQTIPVVVAARDRNMRQFKIAITPDGTRTGASSRYSQPSSRAGDLFDYEPVQHENGEIEYVVQISPERLESLAAGTPIEGEVASDIPEVHRFLIFVGVNQLPSQQARMNSGSTPAVLTANDLLVQAGAEVRANDPQSRISAPTLNKTQFQSTPSSTTRTTDPLTQFNNRTNDLRNWRNGPDQSTVAPPPLMSTTQPSTTTSLPRTTASSNTIADRNYVNQPTYGNQYPPAYTDVNTGYGQQNVPVYSQNTYPPATGYQQQPIATVAARPDAPQMQQPGVAPGGWTPTVVNNQPVATQPVAQAAAPVAAPVAAAPVAAAPVATVTVKEDPKSSWPLVLTSLALFASIGFNLWLGWLAWSFFWRYREAVTESARVRSQVSRAA